MHTLAIGDIHGCSRALRILAETVPFAAFDTVVTLGDHVDRGPDSYGVVEWLIDWGQRHHLVSLKGNHEILMLDALQDRFALRQWLEVGGSAAIESYRAKGEGGEMVPESHRLFLEGCLPYWETKSHIFVHASVDPALPMEKQSGAQLYWNRADFSAPPHVSGKRVICGHTAQRNGIPKSNGHVTCIDTWAYGGGWLTAMDVNTGAYWQTRETGEVRRGMVEE